MNPDNHKQRIPPVRGLIATHNAKQVALELTDLKKWITLSRDVHKVEKIDVRAVADGLRWMPELLDFASALGIRLSLRTATTACPEALPGLYSQGLLDVFLCPDRPGHPGLGPWIEACRASGIPFRAQLQAPFEEDLDVNAVAARLQEATAVNVALFDPFHVRSGERHRDQSLRTVRQMNDLVRAIAEHGVEVNLLHLPFCFVDAGNLKHAANWQQFFLDHQQYQQGAYQLAWQLNAYPPRKVRKILEIEMGRQTSFHNAIDDLVLPWILKTPYLYIRMWALHKVSRHLRFLRHRPAPLPETVEAAEAQVEQLREQQKKHWGPVAARCRFRYISDYDTEEFKRELPGLQITPVAGELVLDPRHFCRDQHKHYDPIDAERLAVPKRMTGLEEAALRITAHQPPTREISADDYEIEGHMTHHMPGAIRWFSFTNAELQSTALARLEPPFTMGLTIGGGIASQIGFSFGRHAKIVCPMIAYTHKLILHVAEDGRYALLRDGHLVHPTEFANVRYLPRKLGGILEPRISIWNIDGQIVTQTLLLWEGHAKQAADLSRIKYSVLIISTRYARRLQAALLALAHQGDFDLSQVEIVIAYVPGIDATDDLIDSMAAAYPELRIVRSPFSEAWAKSKGFMINESLRLASGAWVVLLDSDIIVPPNLMAAIDAHSADAQFIAPDGRKMLSPEATARILLGQTRPWEDYEALLASEGEFRQRESDGIPIGYCQCARRAVFDAVPYVEFHHFEGADWYFGTQAVEKFGKETRLDGVTVLHLDHGGSQWYGTDKQM